MDDRSWGGIGETLVLWDVDHTLIENGGISKETYVEAFEQVVGRSPGVRPVTHGRTDLQIMREMLVANGEEPAAFELISRFEEVLREVLAAKADELARRGHVLPGVLDALAALAEEANVLQSVLTGNITENARVKVAAFGLEKWFDLDVGGYGTDDEVRSKLIDASQRKVAAKYGRTFDRASTILVGDTPLDVKAARDGGAKVIAVASGVHGVEELAASGPDATLPDLVDTHAFLATLAAVRSADSAS
jgi:phosphoglycolate phosphatase-like HAD superfamily hydrolase